MKKKMIFILKQLIFCFILLGVAGAIGALIAIGSVKGGPRIFVEKYFDYYANSNWYEMYKNSEIKETKYINLKTFANAMEQFPLAEEETIKNAVVKTIKKDGDSAVATMEYEVAGKKYTKNINLRRLEKNSYIFFSNWKGNVDEYLLENCKIEAPEDATLYLDGIKMEKSEAVINAENGKLIYTLKEVFKGKHTITTENKYHNKKSKEFEWLEDNSNFILTTEDVITNEQGVKEFDYMIEETIINYYKTAFEDGTSEAIIDDRYYDDTTKEKARELFEVFKSEVKKEDGAALHEITEITFDNTVLSYEENTLKMQIKINVKFSAKKGTTALYGYRETYTGETEQITEMIFKYDGNEWKIGDLDIQCIDYSKK